MFSCVYEWRTRPYKNKYKIKYLFIDNNCIVFSFCKIKNVFASCIYRVKALDAFQKTVKYIPALTANDNMYKTDSWQEWILQTAAPRGDGEQKSIGLQLDYTLHRFLGCLWVAVSCSWKDRSGAWVMKFCLISPLGQPEDAS